MKRVNNRSFSKRYCYFVFDSDEDKIILENMAKSGVELATYVLKNSDKNYYEIARHVVDQFCIKLRSKKKDIV